MSTTDWAIIHISDLHFGAERETNRSRSWRNVTGVAQHSIALTWEVQRAVESVRAEVPNSYVVVSGDLTTSADPDAFHEVANYVKHTIYFGPGTYQGLQLGERAVIVPGNHDMFVRSFAGVHNRSDVYPRYFPVTDPPCVIEPIPGGHVVFLLVDTNKLDRWNPYNIRNALGRGEVGEAQRGRLTSLATDLRAGTGAALPPGFSYDRSFKVAVMHHHVAADQTDPFGHGAVELFDTREVLDAFDTAGIDMILCGHHHRSFRRNIPVSPGRVVMFSCGGSATKLHEWMNSFLVYRFAAGNQRPSVTEYLASSRGGVFSFRPCPTVPF